MAETTRSAPRTPTPRKRPRKGSGNGAPARQVEPSVNGSKARAKALYHVYTEDAEGMLRRLGEYRGRNASEAIEAYNEAGGDVEGITFVVVPDRNLARVKADVETKTKVKLSAV